MYVRMMNRCIDGSFLSVLIFCKNALALADIRNADVRKKPEYGYCETCRIKSLET